MNAKIILDTGQETDLKCYIGTLTAFLGSRRGALCCKDFIIFATDEYDASLLLALEYPRWDLQSLTCINDFPYIHSIVLRSDHPTVRAVTNFVIDDVMLSREDRR